MNGDLEYQQELERLRYEKLINALSAIQEAVVDNQAIRDLTTTLKDQKLVLNEVLNNTPEGKEDVGTEMLVSKMDEVLRELQTPREYNIKIKRDFNGYFDELNFKQIK